MLLSFSNTRKPAKVRPWPNGSWNLLPSEISRRVTCGAIECEVLPERLLATREEELVRLKQELDRLETELAKRTVEYVSTEYLYRLSALVRAEIPKVCQAPLPLEEATTSEE